jgi:hypothetical protein
MAFPAAAVLADATWQRWQRSALLRFRKRSLEKAISLNHLLRAIAPHDPNAAQSRRWGFRRLEQH